VETSCSGRSRVGGHGSRTIEPDVSHTLLTSVSTALHLLLFCCCSNKWYLMQTFSVVLNLVTLLTARRFRSANMVKEKLPKYFIKYATGKA
jgi:hypothetical protein